MLAPYSDFVSLSESSLTLQAGVKYPLTLKRRVTTSDTGTNNNSLYFEPSSTIKNVCYNKDVCSAVGFSVNGAKASKYTVGKVQNGTSYVVKYTYRYQSPYGYSPDFDVDIELMTPAGANDNSYLGFTNPLALGNGSIYCEDYEIAETKGKAISLKVINDIGGQYSTSKSSDFAIESNGFYLGYDSYSGCFNTNIYLGYAPEGSSSGWSSGGNAEYRYNGANLMNKHWYFVLNSGITIKKIKVNV